MKKTFSILIFLFIFTTSPLLSVNGLDQEIKYISTSVGATETEVGINYHTNESSSHVLYSLNPDLSSSIKVNAISTRWSYPSEETGYGFDSRYVNQVNLTNLNLDSTYYYQVVAGSTKSSIYQFKTAVGFSSTSFLFVTDTQATEAGYSRVNNLVNNLLQKDPQISFMLMTGDIVDRGGQENLWNSLFSKVEALKKISLATIPGNHEYYLTNKGDYISPEVYNQFLNNPKNGPTSRLNSSYYFKYNDILFIMLDTIKNELYDEQRIWFEQVVTLNPSRFIIVGTHASCYTGGNYDHDATRMTREWAPTFEKMGVDLVLSGHEHMFGYTNPVVGGNLSTDFGVTHLIGPSGAEKQYNVKETHEKHFAYSQNIRTAGCLIKSLGKNLTITLYDESGAEQHSFTLVARRPDRLSSKSVLSLINEFKINYDQDNSQVELTWPSDAYGLIRNVKATSQQGLNVSKFIINPNMTNLSLGNAWTNNNYLYEIQLTLADGEIINHQLSLNLITEEPIEPVKPKPQSCQSSTYFHLVNLTFISIMVIILRRKNQ